MVRFISTLVCILVTAALAHADVLDLLKRGLDARLRGDDDAAIYYLSEAVATGRLSPEHRAAVMASRGTAYENKGEIDRAIADYDETIRLKPSSGEAYVYRGLAWVKKREYERAIADFTEASRDPKYAHLALTDRGNVFELKRDYDRAISDYSAAIEQNPTYANAYYNRGLAWLQKGDKQRAVADFREAMNADPKDGRAGAALRSLSAE